MKKAMLRLLRSQEEQKAEEPKQEIKKEKATEPKEEKKTNKKKK